MAIEFNLGIGSLGEYGAQSLIDQDYGWFMDLLLVRISMSRYSLN